MFQLFGSEIWSCSEEDGRTDMKSIVQDVGHRKDGLFNHPSDRKGKSVHCLSQRHCPFGE